MRSAALAVSGQRGQQPGIGEAEICVSIPQHNGKGVEGSSQVASVRVLMVLDSFSFGGAENLIVELGRSAPEPLSVTAASLAPVDQRRNALVDRLVEAGLDPTYFRVRRLLDPGGILALTRELRRSPADIVHAHLGYSAIVVPLAARLAGKPCVATLHLSPQPNLSRGEKLKELLSVRIPARLGRLVLVSQHAFDGYARLYGPAGSNWRMIHNGVDVDRYVPRTGPRPRIAGIPQTDGPLWAMVAALRPDKNHVDLVRAWGSVVLKYPDAVLLIIGDGPSRRDVERAVEDAGLSGSVRLLGRRDDVPELMSALDGVVSASVDEALPTALIEAAACGLPVVATDAGGTREIVVDGVTGRLVPARDAPALADALLSVIGDPIAARAFGAAGRARVEANFSLTTWVQRLLQLYQEMLGVDPAVNHRTA